MSEHNENCMKDEVCGTCFCKMAIDVKEYESLHTKLKASEARVALYCSTDDNFDLAVGLERKLKASEAERDKSILELMDKFNTLGKKHGEEMGVMKAEKKTAIADLINAHDKEKARAEKAEADIKALTQELSEHTNECNVLHNDSKGKIERLEVEVERKDIVLESIIRMGDRVSFSMRLQDMIHAIGAIVRGAREALAPKTEGEIKRQEEGA